jgi:hypothetical protein
MIGAIAASAPALGSSPLISTASTVPNSGVSVISGAVRDAPMRAWLTFRRSQPSTKCTMPASAKIPIVPALASPSRLRSSDTRHAATRTAVATASWRKVDT